jgi:hypothetical protein
MASSYIENKGNGHFEMKALPLQAQAAPVYGMMSEDVDGDGNLDILLAGNDYGMDPYTGRNDAFMGLCLKGDGKGNFNPLTIAQSGFFVPGDGKALAKIHDAKNNDLYIATQNQDSVMVYAKSTSTKNTKWINLQPEDFSAEIIYKNGNKKHVEFYYGNTYLTQSSRKLELTSNIDEVIVVDFKGSKREIINR